MTGKKKERLDNLLIEKGLAATTENARALIMAGKVVVDEHRIDKAGFMIFANCSIRIKARQSPYVSRGGMKLEKPLEVFNICVSGKTVLDVGASTGGFTDCLLSRGAEKIFAVDVGYGQLAWALQKDSRVINLERTNIRKLSSETLGCQPDIAVIDVSFISLKKVLSSVMSLLTPRAEILCLIKPQFEAEKNSVAKGGIVRDETQQQAIIKDLVLYARSISLFVSGVIESPIQGHKGNREFFMYLKK